MVSESGAKTASFRYDPLGRLMETAGPAGTTRSMYDGDELVWEMDGNGRPLRRYANGSAVDDPVVWLKGGRMTQPRFLQNDWQGSITDVSDQNGAAIALNLRF